MAVESILLYHERFDGRGYGYTANVPLPRRCGDEPYLDALYSVVAPLLRAYRPEMIVLQYGVDGHYLDPLVRLALTATAYGAIARLLHDLAHDLCGGRLLVTGGGGYNPEPTARCWAILAAILCGEEPSPAHPRYGRLFDNVDDVPADPRAAAIVRGTVERLLSHLAPIKGGYPEQRVPRLREGDSSHAGRSLDL